MKLAEIGNFNKAGKKPIVLVSPLDWGLGHTVRCIPIIQELLDQGCTVVIACNSVQKALLSPEFPNCRFVSLPGYELRYGTKRWSTIGRIVLQVPKILIRINNENRWLNTFLKEQPVNGIISDNRFGLYSDSAHSVFITHQLHIKTALGNIMNGLAQWMNYRRIERFKTCWVPDFQGRQAIAGELSNPARLPGIPVHFMGGLSRLRICTGITRKNNLLIILSGPEPQRTIFEQLLLRQLEQQPMPTVLVRGLPEPASAIKAGPHVTIYNHAPVELLNRLLCEAEMVISRSGYTTVMDLLKLGKKSILVPTPGQAEQEYLADHLHRQQLAYAIPQKGFFLQKALTEAGGFAYKTISLNMEAYRTVVAEFIKEISN